jgi:hypothetical protein
MNKVWITGIASLVVTLGPCGGISVGGGVAVAALAGQFRERAPMRAISLLHFQYHQS